MHASMEPFRESAERYFGEALPSRRGAEGLRFLALRIQEAAFAAHEDLDQRAFVEAAGSLLALILADHVGEAALVRRDERLRLKLGPRGWVDPFAAVEGALESDTPARTLQERVAQAEAEASDKGTVSRVLKGVEDGLEARGLEIGDRFETSYRLADGTELELHEVVAGSRSGSPADAALAVSRFLSMLDGHRNGRREVTSWKDVVERVVPRLVGQPFVTELQETEKGALLFAPVVADLSVAWVERCGNRSRFLTANDLAGFGVSNAVLHHAALANLARASAVSRYTVESGTHGPLVTFQSRDGLDAARLLLPALAEVLEPELGTDFLVAVPHRDTLLAARREDSETLLARVRDAHSAAPHRISAELLRLPLPALDLCAP